MGRDSTNSKQIRNKEAKVPKIHPAQTAANLREASRVGGTRGAQRERERTARGPTGVEDEEEIYFINNQKRI